MDETVAQWLTEFEDKDQFLAWLSPRERDLLLQKSVAVTIEKEQEIARPIEPVKGVYLIIDGLIRLREITLVGGDFVAGNLGSGDVFGLISGFDGKPSLHYAYTVEPTRAVLIPGHLFREIVNSDAVLSRWMAEVLSHRLRHAYEIMQRFQPGSQKQKVLRSLLIAVQASHRNEKWAKRQTVSITQSDLASMLGISRQTVSRILKKLEASALIEIGYGEIRILDLGTVLKEAEGDV